jgi:hypothetical protein
MQLAVYSIQASIARRAFVGVALACGPTLIAASRAEHDCENLSMIRITDSAPRSEELL